jgi:hypothetical protein
MLTVEQYFPSIKDVTPEWEDYKSDEHVGDVTIVCETLISTSITLGLLT